MAKTTPQPKPRTRGPKLEPHQIVLRPLVTEKSTHLSTRSEGRTGSKLPPIGNAYCFEVNAWATKDEIKNAVQELFGVRVAKVRTQNRLGKHRRYRFKMGRLPNWKKAIVTLHEQDRIEFF